MISWIFFQSMEEFLEFLDNILRITFNEALKLINKRIHGLKDVFTSISSSSRSWWAEKLSSSWIELHLTTEENTSMNSVLGFSLNSLETSQALNCASATPGKPLRLKAHFHEWNSYRQMLHQVSCLILLKGLNFFMHVQNPACRIARVNSLARSWHVHLRLLDGSSCEVNPEQWSDQRPHRPRSSNPADLIV